MAVFVSESWEEGEVDGHRESLLEALESYRRGLADAPMLRRWSAGPVGGREPAGEGGGQAGEREKADDQEEEGAAPMTFVVSSEEVDRHGDVVLAQGWRLESYRRNPVFLWAHDYSRPVIGRALSVWSEPGQLLARMEFAPTDFAREVAALYRSGYQQGVSVGFKPLRYEERRQERTGAFLGIRFLEQELLEVSAVPVPANREALRRAFRGESFDRLRMSGTTGDGESLDRLRLAFREARGEGRVELEDVLATLRAAREQP